MPFLLTGVLQTLKITLIAVTLGCVLGLFGGMGRLSNNRFIRGLATCYVDNIFVLYVFWELTTIASFLLIAFWFEREKSRYGALKSLVITILGGLSMLAGFIMLAIVADTYSIRAMMASVDLISGHSISLQLIPNHLTSWMQKSPITFQDGRN